jgi:proteic killer suppression protein
MRVVFRDARLAVIRTENHGQLGFPVEVVQSVRRKLVVLDAAPDERTLRNWKSLHFEKLGGDREGQRSVRINDKWRLVFLLDVTIVPPTIEVLAIENHYR